MYEEDPHPQKFFGKAYTAGITADIRSHPEAQVLQTALRASYIRYVYTLSIVCSLVLIFLWNTKR